MFVCFLLKVLLFHILYRSFRFILFHFCKWCKIGVQFCSSTCEYPAIPTPFTEKNRLFSIEYSWLPYQILVDYICLVLFLCSQFCFFGLLFLIPVFFYFDDYCFIVQLEIRKCDAFCFVFLWISLTIWEILWFHINCRSVFSISIFKKGILILGNLFTHKTLKGQNETQLDCFSILTFSSFSMTFLRHSSIMLMSLS